VGPNFSAPVHTGSGAHPASSTMENKILFLGAKLSGSAVDHASHLVPRLKKEYGNISNPLYAFVTFSRVQFSSQPFNFLYIYFYIQKVKLPPWMVGWLVC